LQFFDLPLLHNDILVELGDDLVGLRFHLGQLAFKSGSLGLRCFFLELLFVELNSEVQVDLLEVLHNLNLVIGHLRAVVLLLNNLNVVDVGLKLLELLTLGLQIFTSALHQHRSDLQTGFALLLALLGFGQG